MARRFRLNRSRVLIIYAVRSSHIGSGVWGIFDAEVMGWRITDLAEHEAHQQAADPQRHVQSVPVRPTRPSRSHRSQSADRGAIGHLVSGGPARLVGE
jgi:hypothetical protein